MLDFNLSTTKYLSNVSEEIFVFINKFENDEIKFILNDFFKIPGKMIRPSLLFLSASAANPQEKQHNDSVLVKLGLALELIHSASLIHDDIIDQDILRRGQETICRKYGEKIAVLVGDVLFTEAYAIVAEHLPVGYVTRLTNLASEMCIAEIIQTKTDISKAEYIQVIQGKTASFMAVSCELGALYADVEHDTAHLYKEFGMALGMMYQINDDQADRDVNGIKYYTEELYQTYKLKAETLLDTIENSTYQQHLKGIFHLIDQT